MSDDYELPPHMRGTFEAIEFYRLVAQALLKLFSGSEIVQEKTIKGAYIDFLVTPPEGKPLIIEAKRITPSTEHRIRNSVNDLKRYAEIYEHEYNCSVRLALAVPGVLSEKYQAFLADESIELLDGPTITRAASAIDQPPLLEAQQKEESEYLAESAETLISTLERIPPGRDSWSLYQSHICDTLTFLLCPPLGLPITESSNNSGINRRDIIFPNYTAEHFWSYMRSFYEAHYVVVDAKNYTDPVPKSAILQLSNYLSIHGAGLFGIIASRRGCNRGAEITRREQWLVHHKMIITLNDDDMRQMIRLRVADADPTDVIRQKIEDFRLGF